MIRPEFSEKMSIEKFETYYWYKDELKEICRTYQLPVSGTKAELEQYIKRFLAGKKVKDVREHNARIRRSEEHTSELQSRGHLVCRLLLVKKNRHTPTTTAQ